MTAAGQGVAPELSARVCLDLGHAYAEHAAKRAGVRLLHIKGLAADRVLPIDDARVSDVDVLLDPEGLTRFTRVLLEREDCLLVDDASRSTEAHAVAVAVLGLGVTIDVHGHFPGFRASPEDVFAALWSGHGEETFGGWTCKVPGRGATAVVGLLHAARNLSTSRTVVQARERWESLTPNEQAEAREFAESLGATVAMESVLHPERRARGAEEVLWRLRQRGGSPTAYWLAAILAAPGWRGKAILLRRAALTQRASNDDTHQVGPEQEVARTRLQRLLDGVKALPSAAREVLSVWRTGQ